MIITPRIAGKPLELYKLQHKYEIKLSVNVKNYIDWAISSRVSNRKRFNDYLVAQSTSNCIFKFSSFYPSTSNKDGSTEYLKDIKYISW